MKGIRLVDIAKKAGVSRAAISAVIRGRIKSSRLREAVAEAVGLPVEAIWDGRKDVCE